MANTLEFENRILEQSLKFACGKLYEMGYCVNRGMCKRSFPNCKKCMHEFFTQKSFKELVTDVKNDKAKS